MLIIQLGLVAGERENENLMTEAELGFNGNWLPLHHSIKIITDSELLNLAAGEALPGTGTETDPIILEGYLFKESTGTIRVINTFLHFKIENCTIETNGIGIWIENSCNITLNNITFLDENHPSIWLDECSNTTISSCDLGNGPEDGIRISDSRNIGIVKTDIKNCSEEPLWVTGTNSLFLQDLVIINNSHEVMFLDCNDVMVNKCNVSENHDGGIIVGGNQNITISSCELINNGGDSIHTDGLNDFTIRDCIFENFSRSGLHLDGRNLLVEGNYFKGLIRGLEFDIVYSLVMYNNTFLNCGVSIDRSGGIFLDCIISKNNTVNGIPILMLKDADYDGATLDEKYGQLILANITDLTIKKGNLSGIGTAFFILCSSGIVLDQVKCSDTIRSIFCWETDNLTIIDSDICDSNNCGIQAWYCNDLAIKGNRIMGSDEGFNIGYSNRVSLHGNTISHNRENQISGSLSVAISNNHIQYCTERGIRVQRSDNILIHQNKFENSYDGISVTGPRNITIDGNILNYCSIGIRVTEGYPKSGLSNIIIKENSISSVKGDGIYIDGDINVTLYSNVMTFSGLRVSSSNSNIALPANNTLNGKNILIEKDSFGTLESDYENPAQVILLKCASITFSDHSFSNVSSAIQLLDCVDMSFNNLSFSNVSSAVQLQVCSNLEWDNISITKSVEGFYLSNCPDISVFNSIFIDVATGILSYDSYRLVVNGVDIIGGSIGLRLIRSNSVNLTDILLQDLENIGLDANSLTEIKLDSNIFMNCSIGADYDRIYNSNIYNNIFFKCSGPGLIMSNEPTAYNTIYSNIFLFNNGSLSTWDPSKMQAIEKGNHNQWNISGKGNYWSDWQWQDDNGDGIVDDPCPIPGEGGGIDHYPLIKLPFTIISKPRDFFGVTGNGWVNLTWEAPEVDYLGKGINYTLYRAVGSLDHEPLVELGSGTTWYNDTTVKNGIVHSYYLIAKNELWNSDPTISLDFLPDGSSPYIVVLTPEDGAFINQSNVTLTWNITDAHSDIEVIEIRMDQRIWFDVTESESFHFPYLEDGPHIIEVRAKDIIGNMANKMVNITIDTTPPKIEIFWPGNSNITNIEDIEIGWNCSDALSGTEQVLVKIDDGIWKEYNSNITTTFSDLTHGIHKLVINTMDKAGNREEEGFWFQVDLVAPLIKILQPENDILKKEPTVMLTWEHSDEGSGVKNILCSIDGIYRWNVTWASTGHEVILDEGVNNINLTIFDHAGNIQTTGIVVNVDTIPPRVRSHCPIGLDIGTDVEISSTFSEEMDRKNTTLSVLGAEGTISWEGNTIVFTPSGSLIYNKEYTAISNGKDLAGNIVEFSWNFTTKEMPSVNDNTREEESTFTIIVIIAGVVIFIIIAVIIAILFIRSRKEDEHEE